jgi:hypothetical protein
MPVTSKVALVVFVTLGGATQIKFIQICVCVAKERTATITDTGVNVNTPNTRAENAKLKTNLVAEIVGTYSYIFPPYLHILFTHSV